MVFVRELGPGRRFVSPTFFSLNHLYTLGPKLGLVFGVDLKPRAVAREPKTAFGESLGFILSSIQLLVRTDRQRDLLGTRSCTEACVVQLGDTVRNYSEKKQARPGRMPLQQKQKVQ